jgi:NitT/TauT family transport system ATP-binding protein
MKGDLVPVRAGFIPLVDATVLIAAADRGFAADEGLALGLVREVSWSNVRDKLKLGHFDAAHILAPLPIAETLGLDYARVPMTAPFSLNLNGNSIIVDLEAAAALTDLADGDLTDPAVSGAALKRLITIWKAASASMRRDAFGRIPVASSSSPERRRVPIPITPSGSARRWCAGDKPPTILLKAPPQL